MLACGEYRQHIHQSWRWIDLRSILNIHSTGINKCLNGYRASMAPSLPRPSKLIFPKSFSTTRMTSTPLMSATKSLGMTEACANLFGWINFKTLSLRPPSKLLLMQAQTSNSIVRWTFLYTVIIYWSRPLNWLSVSGQRHESLLTTFQSTITMWSQLVKNRTHYSRSLNNWSPKSLSTV